MYKKLSILFLSIFIPINTYAQNSGLIPRIESPVQEVTLDEIINRFSSLLAPITIIILIVVIMAGGAQIATAGSDSSKVEKGTKIIQSALIGFAIIVLAPVIIQFFAGLFGVRSGVFIGF